MDSIYNLIQPKNPINRYSLTRVRVRIGVAENTVEWIFRFIT